MDNRIKSVLESEGFQVTTVFEENLTGSKDVEIADYCEDNSSVIFTHDEDFLSIKQNPRNTVQNNLYPSKNKIQRYEETG